jgi:hypothetical protein
MNKLNFMGRPLLGMQLAIHDIWQFSNLKESREKGLPSGPCHLADI